MNNLGFILHASQCTNDCVFCGKHKSGDIKKNIRDEFDKIKNFIKINGRVDTIEISGNDPGEYAQLPQLVIKIKKDFHPKNIILCTHGKNLIDFNFTKRLIIGGINHFIIPIYGHNAEIHDKVTRTKGSFELTMKAIKKLQALKQNVSYLSLITRENQNFLKPLFLFLSGLEFYEFCRVGLPCFKTDNIEYKLSIPDFTRLKNQLSDALQFILNKGIEIELSDTPFCLINFYYDNIVSNVLPEKAYEHWRDVNFIQIIKDEVVPHYRVKFKADVCKQCRYMNECGGIYKSYYDYGYFRFFPILK
jgi:MoaA/NifB/PqqE/SkfB family radical SAM enzyme